MNKKLIIEIIAVIALILIIVISTNKTPSTSGKEVVTSVTIMVPPDMDAYDAAMNEYIFDGKPNPSANLVFIKKTVAVASTTDSIKASAQAAAEVIHSQGGKAGAHLDYFEIVDGTAYVLPHMWFDGWAGVSISIAKIEPLIEKTLLQFPEIKSVKFEKAPNDMKGV